MEKVNEVLFKLRKDYSSRKLEDHTIASNPFEQFEKWFNEASSCQVNELNAMTLSTVNEQGRPSSRIVLLRGFDSEGLRYYTNYNSRKGKETLSNPWVCINIFWPELERQIRVEGKAIKLSDKVSDAYFRSRPRESQIGAWASAQSTQIKNREELLTHIAEIEKRFQNKEVERPSHWGGFLLQADYFEFWQGGAHRLHDRISYLKQNTDWKIARLSP